MATKKTDDWFNKNDPVVHCFWCGKYWPNMGICDDCAKTAVMKNSHGSTLTPRKVQVSSVDELLEQKKKKAAKPAVKKAAPKKTTASQPKKPATKSTTKSTAKKPATKKK